MKDYIAERVKDIADYLIEHRCTVREVARAFCVSKSTAHKDLVERLPQIDVERHGIILGILAANWEERYLRGGEATKRKFFKG